MIENILDSAFSKVQDFLQSMQTYLQIYWSNQRIDFKMLINEKLRSPTEMLMQTTKLFKIQKERFEGIPQTAFRGLLKLENNKTREILIPSPKACITQLERIIPETIKRRTDEMRRWLSEAIKALSKPTASVEDFVEQSNQLNRVQEQF